MERRNWDQYYESIKQEPVAIGDLVGRGTTFGRVTGFTATQIQCVEVEHSDLQTPKTRGGKPVKFNLQKDKGYGGGGDRIGDRWHTYRLLDEGQARTWLEVARREDEQRNAAAAEREAARKVQVAQRKKRMRKGYKDRQLLSQELGVWSMRTTNDAGQPVLITWTVERDEEPDWNKPIREDGEFEMVPRVDLSIAYWRRVEWAGRERIDGPVSISASGRDELTTLASRRYG